MCSRTRLERWETQDRCCTRFDLKIALPRHVRPDDRASPRGDFSLGFSFAIPSPEYTPFHSHQVETFLPTYSLGRFYLAGSVKRLLQVGQNWKVELRISFRSFRVIQLVRMRARVFSTHDLSTFLAFPVLLGIHQSDSIPENRIVHAK